MTALAASETKPSRRAAWYLRTNRGRARLRQVTEALADGFWLGLMDRHHLRDVDRWFYAQAVEDVDGEQVTYADPIHVRSGLAPWEQAAVGRFPPGARVLVTSAGAGREVHGLLDLGFDAHGVEPNPSLVRAGQAVLADPARLSIGEYDEFPADHGPVDAVVIGWGSYMLIAGAERRIRVLAGAHAALAQHGLLLVSYFCRPATRYFAVVELIANSIRRVRGVEPMERGDALSPNFVHYFTPDEIRRELELAGFDVVEMAAEPYGHCLARRR